MDWTYLIGALAFGTLFAWIVIAYISKRKTEERLKNAAAPTSTLAKDGDAHGKPADV